MENDDITGGEFIEKAMMYGFNGKEHKKSRFLHFCKRCGEPFWTSERLQEKIFECPCCEGIDW